MALDWARVEQLLDAAVVPAFDDLAAALKGQRLYALALVTEDGAMGVGLAANTEEAFAERERAELAEPETTPEDLAWCRWGVGEWAHEGWRDDLFTDINDLLGEEAMEGDIADMDAHLARLVAALTAALATLRRERAAALADTALFVTLTDSDDAEAVEDASARQLNDGALRDAFLARYG